nr:hypothetical protein [uncultured Ruminococcus sp.]
MDLKDTIALMTSDDYKDRFKAEYYQLQIRHEKLLNMLARHDTGTLGFDPTCSIGLLAEQCGAMGRYLRILEARAKAEGIALD